MDNNHADKEQRGFGEFTRLLLSWPGLAIAASAVALLLEGVHFQLPRPPSEGGAATEGAADLRVDARSWKDPFQAVLPSTPMANDTNVSRFVSGTSNTLSAIANQIRSVDQVAIMVVLVNGSPYPNGVESRIRTRVAIQAAMRVGGFVNEDSEHLKYLIHARTTNAADAAVTVGNRGDWAYVPYEWFETDTTAPHMGSTHKKVLLLWLRETDFKPAPFARLHVLLSQILPNCGAAGIPDSVQFAILGPRTSGGLEAMIKDVSFLKGKHPNLPPLAEQAASLLLKARIISTTATAPDAFFVANALGNEDLSLLRRVRVKNKIEENLPGSTFTHFGATDADLCYLLLAELGMRGVDARTERVVLMSEYDTFYGRQLPLTFKAAVLSLDDITDFKFIPIRPENLVTTILNGQGVTNVWSSNYVHLMARFESNLVQLQKTASTKASSIWQYSYLNGVDGDRTLRDNPKTNKKESGRNSEDEDSIDRPEGEHQLDYMSRLALELNGRWEGLLQRSNNIGEVKAISVLGGDFYDKLLMLQALRSSAPRSIFFTTDLDARLNLRSQRSWTRNVITAAGFDLRPPISVGDPVLRLAPMRDDYQTATFVGCLSFLCTNRVPSSDLGVYEIGRLLPHHLNPPSSHIHPEERIAAGSDRTNFAITVQRWWFRLERAPQQLAQAPTLAAGVASYLIVLLSIALLDKKRIGQCLLGLLWLLLSVVACILLFEDGLEPLELGDGVSSFAAALLLFFTLALIGYTFICYNKESVPNADPTGTPALVIASAGLLGLVAIVIWPVNPPFRGPGSDYMRCLVTAVWYGSGVAVIVTALFWRRFMLEACELLSRLTLCAEPAAPLPEPEVPEQAVQPLDPLVLVEVRTQEADAPGPEGMELASIVTAASKLAHLTEQSGRLHFLPMAVLLMLVLACNPWTDAWYWTPWMVLLIGSMLAVLLSYPIALNRLAARLRDELNRTFLRIEDDGKMNAEFVKSRKSLDRLTNGCFAPLSQQPVFAALGTALGTSGIVSLVQPLMAGR